MSTVKRSHGSGISSTIADLHRDSSGLFAISHLVTATFLTIATVCILNVGSSLVDRTRQQRQTDAIAESLGVWKARHMNAVVAHQHLIGELWGLVIAHHAIGGNLLDEEKAADTQSADRQLSRAQTLASACRTGTPAYPFVSRPVLAGEALLDAHLELKHLLTKVYYVKAAALAMQAYPPTQPAGRALEQAADLLEQAIRIEWHVLERIRRAALGVRPFKQLLVEAVLPQAMQQLKRMVEEYPNSQSHLRDTLASKFGLKIQVLASDQDLPLIEDPIARLNVPPADWKRPEDCDCPSEPADNMRHQLAKVTQLSRATFPWVNYNRKPVIDFMKPITPLSSMAQHYFDHTAGVSKMMMDRLQRRGQYALYVLEDYKGPDKCFEKWMKKQNSAAADKAFGLTVITGKESRRAIGTYLFGEPKTVYRYRYASAMLWNRHAPHRPAQRIDLYCKRIVPSVQAQTGWDTLNWSPGVQVSELVGFGIPHVFPSIEPAWTSRLSPTTSARIKQMQRQPCETWAEGIRQVLPDGIASELVGI